MIDGAERDDGWRQERLDDVEQVVTLFENGLALLPLEKICEVVLTKKPAEEISSKCFFFSLFSI